MTKLHALLLCMLTGTVSSYGMQQSRKAFVNSIASATTLISAPALASEFTPGGSLVDRPVGIQVGNSDASSSRAIDNTNVLFTQDFYFKFGSAAPWITPDSTDYPTKMPFVVSQQRYDALKKYKSRVLDGLQIIKDCKEGGDPSDPIYALRPMGLLANNFMASENTGTTNELLLARWYINEIYLAIIDMKSSPSAAHDAAINAANSYLSMINRQISAKVGDKLEYL